MLSAVILPTNLLVNQRFHHDEALYATWALQIISGQDVWLAKTPIDKPPLFIYIVAVAMALLGSTETAARLPSLLATACTVSLTFGLGRKLYDSETGLVAAWLVALSPFTILFAPTALTDPLMTTWLLASLLLAVHARPILKENSLSFKMGRAGWVAGLFLGLAMATKQQAIFFVPLVIALRWSRGNDHWLRFTLAVAIILALTFLWDAGREHVPSFLLQSATNYGGLVIDIAGFRERGEGFLTLLQYGTASPILNNLFLVGGPCLLVWERNHQKSATWLLSFFILAFLFGHALFSFQVWDRYLLALIPLLALLGARLLWWPYHWILDLIFPQSKIKNLKSKMIKPLYTLGLTLLLLSTLARPVSDAVNGRYPLGSNSHALQGIEQIVAYLQGHVGVNHTLYHRWLGTHWRFYLWNYPYDLEYWDSPEDLAKRAKPDDLIAFPSWYSDSTARLALAEVGLTLQELTRTYNADGVPSIILYQIQPKVCP